MARALHHTYRHTWSLDEWQLARMGPWLARSMLARSSSPLDPQTRRSQPALSSGRALCRDTKPVEAKAVAAIPVATTAVEPATSQANQETWGCHGEPSQDACSGIDHFRN